MGELPEHEELPGGREGGRRCSCGQWVCYRSIDRFVTLTAGLGRVHAAPLSHHANRVARAATSHLIDSLSALTL